MKKIFLLMIFVVGLYGWETTTHRAIDQTALKSDKVVNLKNFVEGVGIDGESYENEIFEGYGLTYFQYFDKELSSDAMAKWGQEFSPKHNYQDLIEAGTMLEDAQWQNNALWGANGRFLNHFYDPQNGGKGLWWNNNAVDWAKGLGSGSRFNYYSYSEAMRYFVEGFTNKDASERRRFQAKMLVSVGHLMHLVNDMNVPAHVRADAHPLGDPLEVWMRGGWDGSDASQGFHVMGSKVAVAFSVQYSELREGV